MSAIRAMRRRIMMTIGRCVLRAVNDSGGLQIVQLTGLSDEVLDGVERMQQYGLTSSPLPGAEAVTVFVGGNRSHGIVVAIDDRRYRLSGLQPGEVALYDDQGQKVVLYRDRIEVEAQTVVVKSDDVHLGAHGGNAVARVGDRVNVNGTLWPIVEGSSKVNAQ